MKKIINWLRDLFYPSNYKLEYVAEFPKKLNARKVYIEGNSKINEVWYAKFICPCGCGEELTLNLIDDVSPNWKIEIKNGPNEFSIYPSVRRNIKCKSHFWIRNSKIKWCKD